MQTVSDQRVEANRRNASRSTGPKTLRGKRAVRFNAVRHGLLAKTVVIPTGPAKERKADFTNVLRRLQRDLRPQGIREQMAVERAAVAYWRKGRALRGEVGEIQGTVELVEANGRAHAAAPTDADDETALAPEERQALHESLAGLDFLLGVLREVRRAVRRTGTLEQRLGARLVHWFGNLPDGFARRCLEIVDRVRGLTFAEEDVDEGDGAGDQEEGSEAPAEVDRVTVPWVTRPLLRLIDKEIKALEAAKARIASPPREEPPRPGEEPMVARCSVPGINVMARNLRYERALDREFDRAMGELERLQAQRRRTATRSGSRKDEREGARPVHRTSPSFESDSVERPEPPVGRDNGRSSA